MDIDAKIAEYEEEARVMLRCADLNPNETGDSYFAQRAVQCAKIANTLKTVKSETR